MDEEKQKLSGEALPEESVARHYKPRRRRKLTLPFRIFLWLLLGLSLVAFGANIFYHRWLADPENVRAFAERKIAQLFPGKIVSIGSANFELFGGLDLFHVDVADEVTGEEIVRLGHVHIDFDVSLSRNFPLKMKAVAVTELFLDLIRSEGGDWNLQPPAASAPTDKPGPFASPFSISLQGAFISIDDREGDYSVSCPLERASAISEAGSFKRWRLAAAFGGGVLGEWGIGANFDLESESLDVDFKVIDIELGKGFRSRMPVSARRVYDNFSPSGLADISGTVTLNEEDGWGLDVEMELKGCGSVYSRFPVQVEDLFGTIYFRNEGVFFEDIAGRASDGELHINGRSWGYGAAAAIELVIESTGAHATPEMMAALPERIGRVAREYNPKGPFDIKAWMKRPAGPKMPYDMLFDIRPRGLEITYSRFPLTISDVTGLLTYTRDKLEITDITGSRGDMRIAAEGSIEGFGGDSEFEMRLGAAGIPLIEEVRRNLPKAYGDFWLTCDPKGIVDAQLLFTRKPHQPLDVNVAVDLRGVSVLYELFPYPLTDGAGGFTIDDGVIRTDPRLVFAHKGATIALSGMAHPAEEVIEMSISAKDLMVDDELKDALPVDWRRPLDEVGLEGRAEMVLTLSRATGGRLRLDEMAGRITGSKLMPKDMPVGLGGADGAIRVDPAEIEVAGIEAWMFPDNSMLLMPVARLGFLTRPTARIRASGGMTLSDDAPSWETTFEISGATLDDSLIERLPEAARSLLGRVSARGAMDVSGDISFAQSDEGELAGYDLLVECRGVSLDMGADFRDVYGALALAGHAGGGESEVRAEGRLRGMVLNGRVMGETALAVETTRRRVKVHRFATEVLGGRIEGRGQIFLHETPGWAFEASFEDLAIGEVFNELLGFRKEGLLGKATGTIKAVCSTGRKSDAYGVCRAEVTEGSLWEVPVILALFNLMDLLIPERSQFTEASIEAEFAAGRVNVKEFSMSSTPATILGKGTIRMDGGLEMTFYSRPGKIPVISLIAGELGRNILEAEVTGSFSSPRVKLVPSGLFGAVVNVFAAPFRREKK